MTRLFQLLRQTRTLWILIAVAIPLTLLSKWTTFYWGLVLLDGISDPEAARTLLSEMTTAQIQGHLWFTTTLDVVYPIAAAGLFASATLKSFGKYGPYLAVVPLIALPLDLMEGLIQVLALNGTTDWLALKAYTTPAKGLGYASGLLLSLAGLTKWLIPRIKNRFNM